MFEHCDAPVNVCIDLNEFAKQNIASSLSGASGNTSDEAFDVSLLGAREITFDEALDILEKTHEAGLVHMFPTQKIDAPVARYLTVLDTMKYLTLQQ
ncbi:unnamed protein product [marine sediment metagenome]|uniref:Uncharacterized protein n=1 Tax=marine sediment metagenome TaxID=412755 RepID=X1RKT2_9ZZZZ